MSTRQTTYRSIGCSYYDQLEAYATQRTHCSIVYDEEGSEKLVEGLIVDVYARDGAEFIKLDDGTVIRLDHLRSVNGNRITYAC